MPSLRDRVLEMAARRNGVDPSRLKFLQAHPDQVVTGTTDRAVEDYVPPSRALDFVRSDPGIRRVDPQGVPDSVEEGPGVTTKAYEGNGTIRVSRQMSMDRLKSYIPPAEPWNPVPILGTGRRYGDKVDPLMLAEATSTALVPVEDGGFTRTTEVMVYRDAKPAAIKQQWKDSMGNVIKERVLATTDEALSEALGERRRPTTLEGWVEYGRKAGLKIEKVGNRWKLNGKRLSMAKLHAACSNPLAMQKAKEDGMERLNQYGESFKKGDVPYDARVGVIQRPTPELYEDGGIFEELFDAGSGNPSFDPLHQLINATEHSEAGSEMIQNMRKRHFRSVQDRKAAENAARQLGNLEE